MTIPVWQPGIGGGTELGYQLLNQPFWVGDDPAPSYDAGTDTISFPVGPGRVDFGGGVSHEAAAQTIETITPVATNTTYYVYVGAAGFEVSTDGTLSGRGRVLVTSVATGATKADLTVTDLRGMLPIPPRRPRAALPGYIDNTTSVQAATQARRVVYLSTGLATQRQPVVVDRAGSIVGIALSTYAARTAGTMTVEAYVNGVATGLTATIDAANTQYSFASQDGGIDTFAAGDRIDVYATTNVFDAGVSERSYEAVVYVEFD